MIESTILPSMSDLHTESGFYAKTEEILQRAKLEILEKNKLDFTKHNITINVPTITMANFIIEIFINSKYFVSEPTIAINNNMDTPRSYNIFIQW